MRPWIHEHNSAGAAVAEVIQLPDRGLDERRFAQSVGQQCQEVYGLSLAETQTVTDLVMEILTELPRPPMAELDARLEAACGDEHQDAYVAFVDARQKWEQVYAALMLRVLAERIERIAEARAGAGNPADSDR
jgi:hypothetical protein